MLQALEPGERLPGAEQLAAAVNVAPATMLHALHDLCDAGILIARARSGMYKARLSTTSGSSQSCSTVPAKRRGRSPDLTLQRLARDILAGRIAAHADLPPMKDLRTRYGVSRNTMLRALHALERDGWLEGAGRWWRTAELRSRAAGATILLIARGATGGAAEFPLAQDHIRYLQRECAAACVHLRLLPLVPGRDPVAEVDALLRRSSGATMVLGVLVWALNIPAEELSRILGACESLPVPTGVFDEADRDILVSRRTAGSRLRAFRTASGERAGYEAGKMLAALGHTRIAFLSDRHNASHSQRRLEGLMRAVEDAGGEAVIPFVADDVGRERLKQRSGPQPATNASAGAGESPGVFSRLAGLFHPDVVLMLRYRLLRSLAEAGLRRGDFTAWVGHNDLAACCCMDVLAERGAKVPGDMSVVGFDDTPAALDYDLTSYDFGGQAAFHAAVTYLLRPDTMRDIGPVYEAPGHMVVRGSTGPVRGRPR